MGHGPYTVRHVNKVEMDQGHYDYTEVIPDTNDAQLDRDRTIVESIEIS